MATRLCVSRGIDSTLVIPADIPLIQAGELDQIFAHAPAEGSVLVPAADGRGTNAAFRRPANLFPLRFGNDSFKPHLAAAQATGKPCVVLQLPGIALDMDNPADLQQLLAQPRRNPHADPDSPSGRLTGACLPPGRRVCEQARRARGKFRRSAVRRIDHQAMPSYRTPTDSAPSRR